MKGVTAVEFEEIYRRYFRDVYRFSLSLAQDGPLAEEIAQDTFFRALKALNTFDGSKDIRAWLFTIARNTWYSHCRSQKRLISQEDLPQDLPSGVRIEERIEDAESAFAIHQFLHAMAEPYKEVFTLRVFGELPYEKIGRLFGKSANWARVTFYRAKVQIITHMEAMEHERDQL